MANHTSIFVWRIPWTEEPGRLQSMGSQRVRLDWATNAFLHIYPSFLSWEKTLSDIPVSAIQDKLRSFSPSQRGHPMLVSLRFAVWLHGAQSHARGFWSPCSRELLIGCPPVTNPRKSRWLDGSLPVSATGTSRPPGLWSQETHDQLHPVC